MAWPPTLAELKVDLDIAATDTRKDTSLQQMLDAAVEFVERVRPVYKYDATVVAQVSLPDPPVDLRLGVLRLAGRWLIRKRSPDGLVAMGEMGSSRVSSFDPDIDRMLGIGRYAKNVIA